MSAKRHLTGALLTVRVMHQRLQPKRRPFFYRGFQLCFDIRQQEQLRKTLRYRTPLSFRVADHGRRDGSDPAIWIRDIFARHGVAADAIYLVTYPRLWGYSFKPVSFWLGVDAQGGLRGVLAEVNNTFGEHHSYLVRHPDGRVMDRHDWFIAEKAFYVSPFFSVDGHYRFRFRFESERVQIDIHHVGENGEVRLITQLAGQRQELSAGTAWRAVLSNPLMSLMVTIGIHWEALKLWRAGIRLQRKPIPPAQEISS
ncbi:DUF1365 domain-containing protein [Acidithiobacillus sp. CV18-2]|uniref:DUF1365 domain-containing protein n=1 Tax=Igneacidithiobacillus copahuensis TaxID=2724909 RepID=A0AAE3CJU8_9PROT|nr:DUF1365 domain-containing protein [Igneacidithiobacillus copahuensis]MBU2753129.1 DUF1365 domain-containing protein [Acidithiobacillus sp. CV18-3]MBU2756723.1 DUF1365 domain-containing protein [Acidithiobacillus sp. BN09-2]MBU2776608.1 DUF1365 domain-containing protein [Acidithiobacillus sp. CV18-2]MBU2796981.1 DUF1365 domain-containing protein [Acidithiobacillus sp. VAN18-2]MBU2798209.1 DUF1365 domain-containing protein [Acidithiobacillus sp. VAN18-4]UTV80464.1 DUF1365 domain-containing p